MAQAHPQDRNFLDRQSRRILESYLKWLGRPLIPAETSPEQTAEALFLSPIVVLSHGTEADPVLNYGNAAALALWEMDWEEFTKTPSRLTAEPIERAERERLLAAVLEKGFLDDYRGVRISKSGRRFLVERATVWNLADDKGKPAGQAAAFSQWRFL